MGQESADVVVYGSNFSFGFPILRRCVRARKSENHPVLSTEIMKWFIVVPGSVITLKAFNLSGKLGFDEGIKRCENREDL